MEENKAEILRAIRAAIETGDCERVRDLIGTSRERLEMKTSFGTWLHEATAAGNLAVVKLLTQMGIDIERKGGTFDSNAINTGASYGQLDIIRHLHSQGAKFDLSDSTRNPLFGAIYNGHADIVKCLLENGIDARVKYTGQRMKNMDAEAFAIERGQTEIAKLIHSFLAAQGA